MQRLLRVVAMTGFVVACAEGRSEPRTSSAAAPSNEVTSAAAPTAAPSASTSASGKPCVAKWRKEPANPCDVTKEADSETCLSWSVESFEKENGREATDEEKKSAQLYCAIMIGRCKKACGK